MSLLTPSVHERTDEYFNKTSAIVAKNGDSRVTYAVFLRHDAVVAAGQAIEFLKETYPAEAAYPLEIRQEHPEGTLIPASTPFLYITGSMAALAPMETLFLQRLGWSCVAARNAYAMAMALPKTPFMDMHARHGTGDDMNRLSAYGASIGSKTAQFNGARGFIGTSQGLTASYFGKEKGMGTMPHALIGYAKARQMAGLDAGDNATLNAVRLYVDSFPDETAVVALVDYDGREVTDSLAVADWFHKEAQLDTAGKTLSFRLDTHGGRFLEGMDWQKSVDILMGWTHLDSPGAIRRAATAGIDIDDLEGRDSDDIQDKMLFGTGVTAAAVVRLREELDRAGYKKAGIVVSSGFDALKCRVFGNLRIPVDMVGTGSFLPAKTSATFATADIVRYELADGKAYDLVKTGREYLMLK